MAYSRWSNSVWYVFMCATFDEFLPEETTDNVLLAIWSRGSINKSTVKFWAVVNMLRNLDFSHIGFTDYRYVPEIYNLIRSLLEFIDDVVEEFNVDINDQRFSGFNILGIKYGLRKLIGEDKYILVVPQRVGNISGFLAQISDEYRGRELRNYIIVNTREKYHAIATGALEIDELVRIVVEGEIKNENDLNNVSRSFDSLTEVLIFISSKEKSHGG